MGTAGDRSGDAAACTGAVRPVPLYHVITPGDHFSARTGSAIPTVVDGLARGARTAGDARYHHHVVLEQDTYRPRYDSATAVEYRGVPAPDRRARAIDAARGRLGGRRRAAEGYFRPAADAVRGRARGIVLAHNAPAVAALVDGHRVVLYAHNDILRTYSRREAGRLLGDVAAIVCVSDALSAQMRERIPAWLHDRVHAVPNGVDTERFTPAGSRTDGPPRVMFVGRTTPEKGADIMLRAAALVDARDVEYVVVGSYGFDAAAPLTPYEQSLRELADAVPGRVRFQPFVDRERLPQLLRQADVLVVPSRWQEPLTLTVGEGLATGLPVVAARRGGIPQALGEAGILFDPEHPDELAAILSRLAADPAERAHLGAQARRRAVSRDWSWSWRRLADILDSLS